MRKRIYLVLIVFAVLVLALGGFAARGAARAPQVTAS